MTDQPTPTAEELTRFDSETDDDLRPIIQTLAQAYCYAPNTATEVDVNLCQTMAVLMLRKIRAAEAAAREPLEQQIEKHVDVITEALEKINTLEREVERLTSLLDAHRNGNVFARAEGRREADADRAGKPAIHCDEHGYQPVKAKGFCPHCNRAEGYRKAKEDAAKLSEIDECDHYPHRETCPCCGSVAAAIRAIDSSEPVKTYAEGYRKAREETCLLPCPPARTSEVALEDELEGGEIGAYNQAWADYAAAIRALDGEETG